MNPQVSDDKDWLYFTSYIKYTETVMSSLIIKKACRDFKEGLLAKYMR